MRGLLAVLVLLLAGCASSKNDVLSERTLPCGPGQDIDIMAYVEMPSGARELGGRHTVTFTVNVFNTSGRDLNVQRITVDPVSADGLALERGYREFEVTIAEGEEHNFEIPTAAVFPDVRHRDDRGAMRREARVAAMAVKVTLTNGDTYLCRYTVGSR